MVLWEEDVMSSKHQSVELNPKESEFSPYKPNEYRLYLAWKALPVNALNCAAIAAELSIETWEIEQLIGIKTQSDFAARFGLHPSTLSEWNSQPIPSEYAHLDWRTWAKSSTKDVVMALLNGILEYGDAARVRLWFQFIDPPPVKNRDENSESKSFTLVDLIKKAEKVLEENGEL